MVAYVTGQFIVSALFATYSSILLTILHVPMSILLGVLAGMVDILPIIGILIAMVPASLMALTVSPATALIVIAGYLFYHGIEDYLIVPKVYGNKLKISTLAVLLAMLIGGVLAGVFGAITALPLVAAYPSLERLWFARHLEPEVLKDHADLRAA
jgi:predicted PurR-regulated permease PerM